MNNHTSSLEFSHFPVMLNEVLKASSLSSNKKIIDCTFGGGGYSREILKFSNTSVQAIDRDKKSHHPPCPKRYLTVCHSAQRTFKTAVFSRPLPASRRAAFFLYQQQQHR